MEPDIDSQKAQSSITTISIDSLSFHKPVFIEDKVSYYEEIIHLSCASLTIQVDSQIKHALKLKQLLKIRKVHLFILLLMNKPYT